MKKPIYDFIKYPKNGKPACKTCGNTIEGEPALSRKDNSEICSSCAVDEALSEL
jgi:hypothetical protein